jgi:DeoR family fructose operon transcriptional repressor
MLLFVILCIDLTFPNIARLLLSVKKSPLRRPTGPDPRALRAGPGVSVSELAREFDVSEMTIRRDLAALEGQSHIRRTHGGAVLTQRMMLEFDYRERRETNRPLKQAIAAAARRSWSGRASASSSTTAPPPSSSPPAARTGENLTVITPSLAVASELQHAAGVEVILLGGVIRRGSPDLTGPVTEHCLELFSADFAFQGADGIGDDGTIYNTDLRLARVDKIMRRLAGEAACSPTTRRSAPPPSPAAARWPTSTSSSPSPGAPAAALKRFARLGPPDHRRAKAPDPAASPFLSMSQTHDRHALHPRVGPRHLSARAAPARAAARGRCPRTSTRAARSTSRASAAR